MMYKTEPPKKKTKKTPEATKPWTENESEVMFVSPAQMVTFDGEGLGEPQSYAPQLGGLVHQTSNDLFLFVPQSQTFPSIDMSIAQIVRKKAKKGETKGAVDHVDLYHVSVSISPQHFATFDGAAWSKAGHLPLDLSATPPTILRSPKAQAQLKAFRDALEAFPEFAKATLNHYYAVVDDKATDLGSLPTLRICRRLLRVPAGVKHLLAFRHRFFSFLFLLVSAPLLGLDLTQLWFTH